MRVLLVEHDADDARMILEMLRRAPNGPSDLAQVGELRQALAALPDRAYDAVLMDLDMPDPQWVESLATVQEQVADRLPVIILTSSDDETLAVEALRCGAQDFLHKTGLTAELLTRTLRYAVERHRARKALLERGLAEASLLHSTALRAAASGIIITDRAGRILWVNPAFTALTGFAAQEVIGQNHRLLKRDCHDRAFFVTSWNAMTSGGIWEGEFVDRRKDGSLRMYKG
ncbi:MAG: response regulator [Limisphaerales bacterium]